jgi:steroid 5-alpha reductase family enzyme
MSTLPEALAQLAASGAVIARVGGDPLTASLALCGFFALFSFIAGTATGWWSWVDRIWSISPAAYVLLFALLTAPLHPRLCLMAALAALWAARLTANFARKGGFGDVTPENEDYRWPVVRAWMRAHLPARFERVLREAFHIFFVCAYQNVLLWLQVAPACIVVLAAPRSALTLADAGAAAAFLALLALEAFTDEAQWAFQSAKHALTPAQRAAAGGDFARGFCTTGVFAWSRHANFFAEQSMWWVFFGFGCIVRQPATLRDALLHYSAVGPLMLSLLFQGSTEITERITAAKYPAYAAYQQTTSRLVPWPPSAQPAGGAPPAAAKAAKARSASSAKKR